MSTGAACPRAARLCAALSGAARDALREIEVFDELPSTSDRLLALAAADPAPPAPRACLAGAQSAGRGRRGRRWASPPGAGLYLSLLWRFALTPARLGPLSLLAGVAAARALEDLGLEGIGLKWPNDLFWRDRKLGGLLLESRGGAGAGGPDTGGPDTAVVIGLGLNIDLPRDGGSDIDQPWASLSELEGWPPVPDSSDACTRLAAALLDALAAACLRFAETGGDTAALDLAGQWGGYDIMRGRAVRLLLPDGSQQAHGEAGGIDDDGRFLLRTPGGTQRFHSGEVSLRPGP